MNGFDIFLLFRIPRIRGHGQHELEAGPCATQPRSVMNGVYMQPRTGKLKPKKTRSLPRTLLDPTLSPSKLLRTQFGFRVECVGSSKDTRLPALVQPAVEARFRWRVRVFRGQRLQAQHDTFPKSDSHRSLFSHRTP